MSVQSDSFKNKNEMFLLDSGATKSVINLSTLNNTEIINTQHAYKLYGVSEMPLKITGTIEINLNIENNIIKHIFIVSEEDLSINKCCGLVGIDFFQLYGISLLLPQNKMKIENLDNILINIKQLDNTIINSEINNINIEMQKSQSKVFNTQNQDNNINQTKIHKINKNELKSPIKKPLLIKLKQDTYIPPRTQQLCTGIQTYMLHGEKNILLTQASQIRHGIISPNIIVKQDETLIVPVIITYITNQCIKLKANTIVAHGEKYKEINNDNNQYTINS
jgi:hypothetical protein